jgi:hypothetical protein
MVLQSFPSRWLHCRCAEGIREILHEHLCASGRDDIWREKTAHGVKHLFPLLYSCPGPCHKRRAGGCCTQLGSLSALKHAVLGLYLLVFLILVGIFILAGKRSPFPSWPFAMRRETSALHFHHHKPQCCLCNHGNHRGRSCLVFPVRHGSSIILVISYMGWTGRGYVSLWNLWIQQ